MAENEEHWNAILCGHLAKLQAYVESHPERINVVSSILRKPSIRSTETHLLGPF